MASRPWRDGQDVLRVPCGTCRTCSWSRQRVAARAGVVELQLNPADLDSLRERMELGVISSSLTEVYEEQVAAYRPAWPPGRPRVRHRRDAVPLGRYGCGRAIRFGPAPGLTGSMSRTRTPRPGSRRSASGVPTRARQPRLAGPGPQDAGRTVAAG